MTPWCRQRVMVTFVTKPGIKTRAPRQYSLRNGTYFMQSSVIIDEPGVKIIGESRDGVIFDAQLENRFIQVGGGFRSTAGTAAINQNSSAVLGTGTNFSDERQSGGSDRTALREREFIRNRHRCGPMTA